MKPTPIYRPTRKKQVFIATVKIEAISLGVDHTPCSIADNLNYQFQKNSAFEILNVSEVNCE